MTFPDWGAPRSSPLLRRPGVGGRPRRRELKLLSLSQALPPRGRAPQCSPLTPPPPLRRSLRVHPS
jgi:hypothetical protein